MVFWAHALVESHARTQSTVATSSGEAEAYAISTGSAEGLAIEAFINELGQDVEPVKLKVRSDSTAGISISFS